MLLSCIQKSAQVWFVHWGGHVGMASTFLGSISRFNSSQYSSSYTLRIENIRLLKPNTPGSPGMEN